MQALSSRPEEGLVCLRADLWDFFHPDTCGISSVLAAEGGGRSRRLPQQGSAPAGGIARRRTQEQPWLWIHRCLCCSCKSTLFFSLQERKKRPPDLRTWAVQVKLATLHRDRWRTTFSEFAKKEINNSNIQPPGLTKTSVGYLAVKFMFTGAGEATSVWMIHSNGAWLETQDSFWMPPLPLAPFRNSTCDFWWEKGNSAEQHVVLETRWGSGGEGRGQGKTFSAQLHIGGMSPGKGMSNQPLESPVWKFSEILWVDEPEIFQGSWLSGIKADFPSIWLQKARAWLKAASLSNCKSLAQGQTASSP